MTLSSACSALSVVLTLCRKELALCELFSRPGNFVRQIFHDSPFYIHVAISVQYYKVLGLQKEKHTRYQRMDKQSASKRSTIRALLLASLGKVRK